VSRCEEIVSDLIGITNWWDADDQAIRRSAIERYRIYEITAEQQDEFSWIFRNYLLGKGQPPLPRQWYLFRLIDSRRIYRGIDREKSDDILGDPDKRVVGENAIVFTVSHEYTAPGFGAITLRFVSNMLSEVTLTNFKTGESHIIPLFELP